MGRNVRKEWYTITEKGGKVLEIMTTKNCSRKERWSSMVIQCDTVFSSMPSLEFMPLPLKAQKRSNVNAHPENSLKICGTTHSMHSMPAMAPTFVNAVTSSTRVTLFL